MAPVGSYAIILQLTDFHDLLAVSDDRCLQAFTNHQSKILASLITARQKRGFWIQCSASLFLTASVSVFTALQRRGCGATARKIVMGWSCIQAFQSAELLMRGQTLYYATSADINCKFWGFCYRFGFQNKCNTKQHVQVLLINAEFNVLMCWINQCWRSKIYNKVTK